MHELINMYCSRIGASPHLVVIRRNQLFVAPSLRIVTVSKTVTRYERTVTVKQFLHEASVTTNEYASHPVLGR